MEDGGSPLTEKVAEVNSLLQLVEFYHQKVVTVRGEGMQAVMLI